MPPALTPAQLELLRHCFSYNDATTHYRSKLSSKEIEDIIQCGHSVVARRRKIWERTGDVEKICKRAGRERSLNQYVEQAIVQIFLQNVDITMEEALD
jgi:transposase